MKKVIKAIRLLVLSVLITTLLIGCSSKQTLENNSDLQQFASEMDARSYKFELKDVGKDFLPTTRKRMIFDKEAIDIYVYSSNKEMEDDARRIDSGGCSYNTVGRSINVSWVSFPHFYKEGTIIIQYVGENHKIISDLEGIFGEQFAGYEA